MSKLGVALFCIESGEGGPDSTSPGTTNAPPIVMAVMALRTPTPPTVEGIISVGELLMKHLAVLQSALNIKSICCKLTYTV
jgi:hypothetical protein